MTSFKQAVDIATQAHEGQTRADGATPYIEHPLAVADLVERWNKTGVITAGPEALNRMRCAAVLHDVVEDTGVTLDELRSAGVEDDVLTLVDLLTKPDDSPAKPAYYARIATNREALIVKCADRSANLEDALVSVRAGTDVARWSAYARKTRRDVFPLFETMPTLQRELGLRLFALEDAVTAAERPLDAPFSTG
jgi:(p)ppGpp synthase/HD superfamily hydrolase